MKTAHGHDGRVVEYQAPRLYLRDHLRLDLHAVETQQTKLLTMAPLVKEAIRATA